MKFHLPCHVLPVEMRVPPSPLATPVRVVLLPSRGGTDERDSEISLGRLDYLLLQRRPWRFRSWKIQSGAVKISLPSRNIFN